MKRMVKFCTDVLCGNISTSVRKGSGNEINCDNESTKGGKVTEGAGHMRKVLPMNIIGKSGALCIRT
jgi:hypothetical protein